MLEELKNCMLSRHSRFKILHENTVEEIECKHVQNQLVTPATHWNSAAQQSGGIHHLTWLSERLDILDISDGGF